MLAKEASAKHKPNKQTIVSFASTSDFLKSLPIKNVRGLRGRAGDLLVSVLPGLETVYDLQQFSLKELRAKFGIGVSSQGTSQYGVDEKFVSWIYNIGR